jgi:hypothetical protein
MLKTATKSGIWMIGVLAAGVLMIVGMIVSSASAATDSTNITITSGTYSMTEMTVADFTGVTLDGVATYDHSRPSDFSVTDLRGLGSGWNITVQATQFREYIGGGYVASGKKLAPSSLSMPNPTVEYDGTGSPGPTIVAGPYIIDSGSAVKIATAAVGDGMGKYDFTQDSEGLSMSIPANADAGSYRSEITVSLVNGP